MSKIRPFFLLVTLLAAICPGDGTGRAADAAVIKHRENLLVAAETPAFASCEERLDEALMLGPYDGVTYNSDDGTWSFVGIVDDTATDRWGDTDVTLVRVRYLYSGTIRTAWVTAGVQLSPASPLYAESGGFLSAGEWRTPDEMRALLQPTRTYVRVYAGRPDEPVATPGGVDWTRCDTPWCKFAQDVENLWTLEDGLSTVFTRTGASPGWWPWEYLPWHIEVGRVDVGWCDYGN